jgi:hypothetical protein
MKHTYMILIITFFITNETPAQWIQTNGLSNENVHSFAASDTNLFAGVYGNGVFLSTDSGSSWMSVSTGLTDLNIYALALSDTNLFAGAIGGGGVFRSTDKGASWTKASTGLLNKVVISLLVADTNLFAGTYNGGVFLSTDKGLSWTTASAGLTELHINALAIKDTNLYAGTNSYVFCSTDNGTSWTVASSNLTSGNIFALAVVGANIFMGGFGGVLQSYNNSTIWTSSGLHYTITSFAVSGTNLFAGTNGDGVFLSTDNGANWTAVNDGLTDKIVGSLTVYNSYLFAGIYWSGVWRRPLSEIITSVDRCSTNLPMHFILNQNYPNPFNPTTTISYQLPANSFTTLKVFDLLGREVATLVNEVKMAGTYTATLNASRFSSGVYFYQLKAENYLQTKKMVILK